MKIAKVSYKLYKCQACGHEHSIQTNHYGQCMNYCKGCSWKAMAHPGTHMLGVWHRTFEFVSEIQ